jgi:hypothetical protein
MLLSFLLCARSPSRLCVESFSFFAFAAAASRVPAGQWQNSHSGGSLPHSCRTRANSVAALALPAVFAPQKIATRWLSPCFPPHHSATIFAIHATDFYFVLCTLHSVLAFRLLFIAHTSLLTTISAVSRYLFSKTLPVRSKHTGLLRSAAFSLNCRRPLVLRGDNHGYLSPPVFYSLLCTLHFVLCTIFYLYSALRTQHSALDRMMTHG